MNTDWPARVRALFDGRRPDRVPIAYMGIPLGTRGLAERFPDFTCASMYNDPEQTFAVSRWVAEQYEWDLVPDGFAHTILGGWDFGGEVEFPQDEYQDSLTISRYPIESPDEIEDVVLPDPRTAGGIPLAMRFAKLQEQCGLPPGFYTRSPFCVASNIIGLERFCRLTLKAPKSCHHLLELALEHITSVADYWLETFGPDFLFGMSSPSESNQVVSPRQLKQFALPYHEKLQKVLAQRGIHRFYFHICGDQNLNLPYLAELASQWPHPAILSFGHEVDLTRAGELFPEDIIMGNVEPALFQTATPDEVYKVSTEALAKGTQVPGGFMLAPGCGMPVWASHDNVYAMTRAVQDWRN